MGRRTHLKSSSLTRKEEGAKQGTRESVSGWSKLMGDPLVAVWKSGIDENVK